jgi:hypothetical protein
MEGNSTVFHDIPNFKTLILSAGVIPQSVAELFSILIAMPACEYEVEISYIELYNEELNDLLGESKNLSIYENEFNEVIIKGLTKKS